MKIVVIKCSGKGFWYREHLNKVFDVEIREHQPRIGEKINIYEVIHPRDVALNGCYLHVEDCLPLEEAPTKNLIRGL